MCLKWYANCLPFIFFCLQCEKFYASHELHNSIHSKRSRDSRAAPRKSHRKECNLYKLQHLMLRRSSSRELIQNLPQFFFRGNFTCKSTNQMRTERQQKSHHQRRRRVQAKRTKRQSLYRRPELAMLRAHCTSFDLTVLCCVAPICLFCTRLCNLPIGQSSAQS